MTLLLDGVEQNSGLGNITITIPANTLSASKGHGLGRKPIVLPPNSDTVGAYGISTADRVNITVTMLETQPNPVIFTINYI